MLFKEPRLIPFYSLGMGSNALNPAQMKVFSWEKSYRSCLALFSDSRDY